tara:strand:- start:524 stop:748 length:225 start_codon:yes stop_codon:yes gene_type:complete
MHAEWCKVFEIKGGKMSKQTSNHTITPTDEAWAILGLLAQVAQSQGKFKIKKGGGGQTQVIELMAQDAKSKLEL